MTDNFFQFIGGDAVVHVNNCVAHSFILSFLNIYFYALHFLADGLAVFYINIEFHDKFAVDKFVIVPLGVLPSAGDSTIKPVPDL